MYKCDKTVKLRVVLSVQIFRSLANLIKGYQHDDQDYSYIVNRIFEGMCAFVVYIEYELFISLNIIFFK